MSQPAPAAADRTAGILVFAAGFGAILLWGGTPIANKLAVAHMDAMTAGLLRSLLAGLVAGAIAFSFRLPFPRGTGDRILLLVSGLTSFAIWPALLSLGLGATTANHAGLILAVLPVTTGLIAAGFDRYWPRLGWWLGAAVAVAGTVLLVFYRSDGDLLREDASIAGDLIVFSGVAICSLGYVTGGRLGRSIGAGTTVLWGLAIAVLVQAPALFFLSGRTDWAAVGTDGWLAIAYLTLMSSLAGYALWFWALSHGGIARVGSFQFLQPVLTLVFAALLLGEIITPSLGMAAALILAGTWIAQRRGKG